MCIYSVCAVRRINITENFSLKTEMSLFASWRKKDGASHSKESTATPCPQPAVLFHNTAWSVWQTSGLIIVKYHLPTYLAHYIMKLWSSEFNKMNWWQIVLHCHNIFTFLVLEYNLQVNYNNEYKWQVCIHVF